MWCRRVFCGRTSSWGASSRAPISGPGCIGLPRTAPWTSCERGRGPRSGQPGGRGPRGGQRPMAEHWTEDDLILYFYGEGRRRAEIEQHLQECVPCAASYRNIAATLSLIETPATPERDDQYGLEV